MVLAVRDERLTPRFTLVMSWIHQLFLGENGGGSAFRMAIIAILDYTVATKNIGTVKLLRHQYGKRN